jgi:hypothetical protein
LSSTAPREVAKIAGAVVGLAAVQVAWLAAFFLLPIIATVVWLFAASAWRAVFG